MIQTPFVDIHLYIYIYKQYGLELHQFADDETMEREKKYRNKKNVFLYDEGCRNRDRLGLLLLLFNLSSSSPSCICCCCCCQFLKKKKTLYSLLIRFIFLAPIHLNCCIFIELIAMFIYLFLYYRCLSRCWTRTTTSRWRPSPSTGCTCWRIRLRARPSPGSRPSTATAIPSWPSSWKPAIRSRSSTSIPTPVYICSFFQSRWLVNSCYVMLRTCSLYINLK